MFTLTANMVQESRLNLAIIADLEQYTAKLECGVLAVNRIANYNQLDSIGKKTGIISGQRTCIVGVYLRGCERMKPKQNVAGYIY